MECKPILKLFVTMIILNKLHIITPQTISFQRKKILFRSEVRLKKWISRKKYWLHTRLLYIFLISEVRPFRKLLHPWTFPFFPIHHKPLLTILLIFFESKFTISFGLLQNYTFDECSLVHDLLVFFENINFQGVYALKVRIG